MYACRGAGYDSGIRKGRKMEDARQPVGGGGLNDSPVAKPAPDVHKRGKRGRRTTFAGIAVLCVSFWLPQIESCGDEIVPAYETVETGGRFLIGRALPFLAGFGLAVLYGLRMILRRARARRLVDGVTCVFCILVLLWGAVMCGAVFITQDAPSKENSIDMEALLLFGMGSAVWLSMAAAVAAVMIRRLVGARRPLCVVCTAFASLLYFLSYAEDALYGLLVSVTACTLITVGSAWEALRILRHTRAPTQAGAWRPET
jgi:hypothetical protein